MLRLFALFFRQGRCECHLSVWTLNVLGLDHFSSLPEFMNLKLFGKTILVVNIKFELLWGHPLSK